MNKLEEPMNAQERFLHAIAERLEVLIDLMTPKTLPTPTPKVIEPKVEVKQEPIQELTVPKQRQTRTRKQK